MDPFLLTVWFVRLLFLALFFGVSALTLITYFV